MIIKFNNLNKLLSQFNLKKFNNQILNNNHNCNHNCNHNKFYNKIKK